MKRKIKGLDQADPDVRELASYYATKAESAVVESLPYLDQLVDLAQELVDQLESNGPLAIRCGVDRCLFKKGKKCRSCSAHVTAERLRDWLIGIREERTLAAEMARAERPALQEWREEFYKTTWGPRDD
jgi:hypothetical protein